jgi:hypothetical protein
MQVRVFLELSSCLSSSELSALVIILTYRNSDFRTAFKIKTFTYIVYSLQLRHFIYITHEALNMKKGIIYNR